MNCYVSVLKSLDDVHSQLYLNNQYYGHYPTFEDSVLVWLKPLNDKAMAETNQIHAEVLQKHIGYLRVPSFQVSNVEQINRLAQSLADTITHLSTPGKKGYIIDLRLNGGGNLYPMLSGLSPFLGNQIIGFETDADEEIVRTWEIQQGNFVIGGYQTSTIQTKQQKALESVPIVIITGPVTKSSGSMVAIAFKGRPNTLFIGEPTADGYTTSNGFFQLASNLILNFATNYVADRNKNIYKTTVNPDITIRQGNNFDLLLADEKIKLAVEWLTQK